MRALSLAQADRLVAFDSDARANQSGNGRLQLEGAVAIHNIIARNAFAYLADEVGMGKTYVALGVMGLLRHYQPDARVVVLAPRENIQQKWVKEYGNFVARNWRVCDNSVRGSDGRPARPVTLCHSLPDLAREFCLSSHQDLFLRMTSFSPPLGGEDPAQGMRRARDRLSAAMPHLRRGALDLRCSPERFRENYGRLINGVVPPIDLLIVDEAHNYKHGCRSRRVALRNQLTALVFGHPSFTDPDFPGFGGRVRRLLLLSATPFETDYADLYNQLDVFGFGEAEVRDAAGASVGKVSVLADPGCPDERKRGILRHVLVRRVTGLRIGDEIHTKNMYRREWRKGGLKRHDEPMAIHDPKQRLIVALVQKKVSEVLGSERFGNRFQIGMLSSFESFLESSVGGSFAGGDDESGDEVEERVFDGDHSELGADERRGIDAGPLAELLRSYRRRFDAPLPHPKLDATVDALAGAFETGEKSLVFVRRIATMGELAARLGERYDEWLERYMCARLPGLAEEVRGHFRRYRAEKATTRRARRSPAAPEERDDDAQIYAQDEESSGTDTFFAWFFRGKENRGVLSGAAFQKNRLISASSAYSTLFEDDHVARLLGRRAHGEVLAELARELGQEPGVLAEDLRRRAFAVYAAATTRRDGYARLHVLEAYQVAALRKLGAGARSPAIRARARTILHEAFPLRSESDEPPPPGFPGPESSLGITSFVTLLDERPSLRAALLPEPAGADFAARFVERERRRELLSALSRLGASYVDLYLLAIAEIGGFELSGGASGHPGADGPEVRLARGFIEILEAQHLAGPEARPGLPGAHAYRELTSAAAAFEDITITNFPEIREQRLWELRRTFGSLLQNQSPVGTSSRSKVKRLVRQFRMPGYPLVLITTDILQEGEDLHTFCARVLHYGITWTPSAMEQRTGRVDRLGSLTQRRLDTQPAVSPEAKLQVYYPHLRDTVEVLQVERVLERLNRFVAMVHRNASLDERDARAIDTARELVAERPDLAQIAHRLESAYPVDDAWLSVGEEREEPAAPDLDALLAHFKGVVLYLEEQLRLGTPSEGGLLGGTAIAYQGDLATGGAAVERFELRLVPERSGSATLIRCRRKVGSFELKEPLEIERLCQVQRQGRALVKLCAVENAKSRRWELTVEEEMLFDPRTTQREEVLGLVERTTWAATTVQSKRRAAAPAAARALATLLDSVVKTGLGDISLVHERGGSLRASLPGGRSQRVWVDGRGGELILTSVIAGAELVPHSSERRCAFIRSLWEHNARTDLVAFGLDRRGRVVGSCRHELATLDREELELYLLTLVRDCDRLEWIFTGGDRW